MPLPVQRYRPSLHSVRGWVAPLMLAAARGRRRPARWWLPGIPPGLLGPCRPERCPVLLAGPGPVPSNLAAIGVHIQVVGSASLRSAVPLGFVPSSAGASGSGPVLVTWDVAGLESLPG